MNVQTAVDLLEFAESTGPALMGLKAKAALHKLEQQYESLLAALQWLIDHERTDEALRLTTALATFWRVTGRLADGLATGERALAAQGGDDVRRGRACYETGMLAFWLGDDGRATLLIQEGLEIARRIGDPTVTALALSGLARIALRSDVGEARRLAREGLAATENTSDRMGRSSAMHVLGVAAQMAGDLLEARGLMTQRIALAREMENYAGASMEANNLSMVERQLGNLERADALAREALDLFHQREDHWAIPYGLNSVAAVARDRDECERATILIGAAEAMMDAQGAAWPPDEREHYERTLAVATAALGQAGFERARTTGRAMSTGEAVAFALHGDPPPGT